MLWKRIHQVQQQAIDGLSKIYSIILVTAYL